MDTLLLSTLLDKRNIGIWEATTTVFPVAVEQHSRTHYAFQFTEQRGTIFLSAADWHVEPFTHQLLHLYLRTKKIFLTEWLVRQLREEPLLHWTFSESLFEQIGDHLEHTHMLPLFLEAGLDRYRFIPDFKAPICNPMLLQLIEGGLHKEIPSIISADLFIRTFIRIKCHPDNIVHYGFYLQRLKNINSALHFLLQRFYEQWESYTITNYHPDHYSYTSFCADFIHELGAWSVLAIHAKEKNQIICLI